MPFAESFSEFFHTRTDHDITPARVYLQGLMQAKRGAKNIERIDEHVAGSDYQSVHNFITHSPWDYRPLMDEVARQSDGLLGGSGRTRLVIDDSGHEKKGIHSVGVARQYNGRLGKVDSCQVSVCASLASGQHSTLCDIRLYLPAEWTDDPQRCEKAGIPEDQRHFRPKSQIALEIVQHQRELGVRFDVVSMDSGYGSQTPLLHDLDAIGEVFVAEVHRDAHVYFEAPWPCCEAGPGRPPLKHPKTGNASRRVDEWAAGQPDTAWQRLKVRDSDQGWVEVSYLAQRVWVTEAEEQKLWWLLVWENPDERHHARGGKKVSGPRRHYALSNAPADADPRRLVADGVERNVVERNFRDGKSETGMSDYQVRGWRAWHHHMALVQLAMLFLLREKMHWSAPAQHPEHVSLTSGDIVFMLERLLPQKASGRPEVEACRKLLEKRMRQRQRDQDRRKRMTAKRRPPFLPDEICPK